MEPSWTSHHPAEAPGCESEWQRCALPGLPLRRPVPAVDKALRLLAARRGLAAWPLGRRDGSSREVARKGHLRGVERSLQPSVLRVRIGWPRLSAPTRFNAAVIRAALLRLRPAAGTPDPLRGHAHRNRRSDP